MINNHHKLHDINQTGPTNLQLGWGSWDGYLRTHARHSNVLWFEAWWCKSATRPECFWNLSALPSVAQTCTPQLMDLVTCGAFPWWDQDIASLAVRSLYTNLSGLYTRQKQDGHGSLAVPGSRTLVPFNVRTLQIGWALCRWVSV